MNDKANESPGGGISDRSNRGGSPFPHGDILKYCGEAMKDYIYIAFLTCLVMGSCVYVEKKNNESYQACLLKAARVIDCEAIKN